MKFSVSALISELGVKTVHMDTCTVLPHYIQLQSLFLNELYVYWSSCLDVHQGTVWWNPCMQISILSCHIAFNCNDLNRMCKIILVVVLTYFMYRNSETWMLGPKIVNCMSNYSNNLFYILSDQIFLVCTWNQQSWIQPSELLIQQDCPLYARLSTLTVSWPAAQISCRRSFHYLKIARVDQ
jgi:hypothetical protein